MAGTIFKYGSFFGITGVHLMFMSVSEIDDIFKMTNIKRSTLVLLNNLYSEVSALKMIFLGRETEGVPHIYMQADDKSTEARDLVNGFNYYIQLKKDYKSKVEQPQDDLKIEVDEESSSSDKLNLQKSTSSVAISATSFFDSLEENTSRIDDTANDDFSYLFDKNSSDGSDGESDGSNDYSEFDSLFDNITESQMDSAEDDFEQLLGDVILDNQDEILTGDLDSSFVLNNLVKIGKQHTDAPQVVSVARKIKPYLLRNKSEFNEQEQDCIIRQLEQLSSVPLRVSLPSDMPNRCPTLSDATRYFLSTLFTNMTKAVNGEISFIDYVLNKLSFVLSSPDCISEKLFFRRRDSMTDSNREVWRWNRTLAELNKSFLIQDNMSVLKSNIISLLEDCTEVLSNDTTNTTTATSEEVIEDLKSTLRQEYQGSIDKIIRLLKKEDILYDISKNKDNLILAVTIYAILCQVVVRIEDAVEKAFEGTKDTLDLSHYCIQFTQETGICGLNLNFETRFIYALQQYKTPLAEKTGVIYHKNSSSWRMVKLLEKHLLSMRKRLFGGTIA